MFLYDFPTNLIHAFNIEDTMGIDGASNKESFSAILDAFMTADCFWFTIFNLALIIMVSYIKNENWEWLKWLVWIVCGLMVLLCGLVWCVVIYFAIIMLVGTGLGSFKGKK